MIKGECNCGAVSFEIDAELKDVYICHCSVCRKWTGNNGVAVTIVPNDSFAWVKGEEAVKKWKKPDADWQSAFCATCGSALPVPNDEARMAVPAGLLDVTAKQLRVAAHIWAGSKASWDVIADCGQKFDGAFGDEG